MRYKITIEYNGKEFVGWQKQKNGLSVEQAIANAIYNLTKENITLFGAGRTDAGVHAMGQVAHFDILNKLNITKFTRSLNHFLRPYKISIIDCYLVDEIFHARFSAKKRYYRYIILNRKSPSVLYEDLAWHVHKKLDIEKMRIAADFLKGKHDFSSFRAKLCQSNSPIKTLDEIRIEQEGDLIILYFSAQSFLHHMVRNIVGTLKLIGEGKIDPLNIESILYAKDRSKAGITAPSYGLYFLKVDY